MVDAPANGRSCFGYSDRDIGHRRVPEPPDRITGLMRLSDTLAFRRMSGMYSIARSRRKS
jgi:hypothetical protein